MRIEVVVAEWEQACCGRAFGVGDGVAWTVSAAAPPDAGAPARYVEEHHGQTPDDVPRQEIGGTVRTITGVTYPQVPVTGEPRSYTLDTAHPQTTPLRKVGAGVAGRVTEYLVGLDVPDGCALPPYVLSRAVAQQRAEEVRAAERGRARMSDPVGIALEAAADHAEVAYRQVAGIVRERSRSAVTIEPRRPEATAVRWARSVHDEDGIGIHTGDGSWWLSATVEHAELAAVFLDAAALGRVCERVVDLDGGDSRFETCVRADDGRTWIASTLFEFAGFGGDAVIVAGGARPGARAYPPWRDAPA